MEKLVASETNEGVCADFNIIDINNPPWAGQLQPGQQTVPRMFGLNGIRFIVFYAAGAEVVAQYGYQFLQTIGTVDNSILIEPQFDAARADLYIAGRAGRAAPPITIEYFENRSLKPKDSFVNSYKQSVEHIEIFGNNITGVKLIGDELAVVRVCFREKL